MEELKCLLQEEEQKCAAIKEKINQVQDEAATIKVVLLPFSMMGRMNKTERRNSYIV